MSGEAIPYGAGPQTRYRVNSPFFEPIDTINDKINISGEVAALVAEGKIEHRGSKKTGGYYAVASGWFLTTKHTKHTKSEKCFGVETHEIVFE